MIVYYSSYRSIARLLLALPSLSPSIDMDPSPIHQEFPYVFKDGKIKVLKSEKVRCLSTTHDMTSNIHHIHPHHIHPNQKWDGND